MAILTMAGLAVLFLGMIIIVGMIFFLVYIVTEECREFQNHRGSLLFGTFMAAGLVAALLLFIRLASRLFLTL